jgi:hypothetical protein
MRSCIRISPVEEMVSGARCERSPASLSPHVSDPTMKYPVIFLESRTSGDEIPQTRMTPSAHELLSALDLIT